MYPFVKSPRAGYNGFMNKRGEAKAIAIIVVAFTLLWLVQWYRMNSDRIDAINQSREFCLEQAYSLPVVWNEDLGQCRLTDDKLKYLSKENN